MTCCWAAVQAYSSTAGCTPQTLLLVYCWHSLCMPTCPSLASPCVLAHFVVLPPMSSLSWSGSHVLDNSCSSSTPKRSDTGHVDTTNQSAHESDHPRSTAVRCDDAQQNMHAVVGVCGSCSCWPDLAGLPSICIRASPNSTQSWCSCCCCGMLRCACHTGLVPLACTSVLTISMCKRLRSSLSHSSPTTVEALPPTPTTCGKMYVYMLIQPKCESDRAAC